MNVSRDLLSGEARSAVQVHLDHTLSILDLDLGLFRATRMRRYASATLAVKLTAVFSALVRCDETAGELTPSTTNEIVHVGSVVMK